MYCLFVSRASGAIAQFLIDTYNLEELPVLSALVLWSDDYHFHYTNCPGASPKDRGGLVFCFPKGEFLIILGTSAVLWKKCYLSFWRFELKNMSLTSSEAVLRIGGSVENCMPYS